MDNLFLSSYIVPNYVTDDCVLLNKDCRDILNCIKRESIDLFCSDVPYRISHKGGGIKKERKEIYAVVCSIVMMILMKIKTI